jgi:hypothetical protein
MRMEDLRYYTIVTLLVLGSAGLNTMIVVWVVEIFLHCLIVLSMSQLS